MLSKNDINNAYKKIKQHICVTPAVFSPYLSKVCGCDVYLKLENNQITGSFKIRGAFNKLLSLSSEEKTQGIVTASSGNHARAVAHVSRQLNIDSTIFLPKRTTKTVQKKLKEYRPEVRTYGKDCGEAEKYARSHAKRTGSTYISPYNDPEIISGQGTIAIEIFEDVPDVSTILVPVGGGGLISGISTYVKVAKPETNVIGVQSEASPVMYESLKAGKIVDVPIKESIAGGLIGGVDKDSITFEVIRDKVDKVSLVSENEIKATIKLMLSKQSMLVEGAAAVTIAYLLRHKQKFKGEVVVLVLTGRNISVDILADLLKERGTH